MKENKRELVRTPRGRELDDRQIHDVYARRDRAFAWLFVAQWVAAVVIAVVYSPYGWEGKMRTTHLHVYFAVFFGAALTLPTLVMVRTGAGRSLNRYVIAALQMMWSALFIHLTGGRLETHFHIFVSLAFLAFYRDWKVLVPATLVIAVDHGLRGFFWSESVYGIANPEWWRSLEHASWVVFEDVILAIAVLETRREMRELAERQASLATINEDVERKVVERTNELAHANASLQGEIDQRERIERELRVAQKLEMVGRVVSGLAEDINTPIQAAGDGLSFVRDAIDDVSAAVRDDANVDGLLQRSSVALTGALRELARVNVIVRSMTDYVKPDAVEMQRTDLNHAIETTLVMARNEYKHVADVETDLGEIPLVTCYAGHFTQGFMRLVIQSAEAIAESVRANGTKGRITVRTRMDGDHVVVLVGNNGKGFGEAERAKLWASEAFAAVRKLVDKHHGTLHVESEIGHGSMFFLRLPISSVANAHAA